MAVDRPQGQRTMEDFWRPVIREDYFALRQPATEANNFELKPTPITMVQQHQFTKHPSEDPNEHMGRFLRMANTVKLNGVRPDVIKLQLFPFSLRDTIVSWFESLPYGSMKNWEELVKAFTSRFFPPTVTSERREKSLYSSKVKMRVSTMLEKGIISFLRDVQCLGLIRSHRWTFYTMP